MASLFDIVRSIRDNGFGQTWESSRNAPGGILDRYRWNRGTPQGALVGDSNIYDPNTNRAVGNTVTNYMSGRSSGNLTTTPQTGRLYAGSVSTSTVDGDGGTFTGGDSGGTGGTVFEPRYFQNVYYTDPAAYEAAVQAAINSEYQRQYDAGNRSFAQQRQGLNLQGENLGYDFTNNLANLQTGLADTLGSQAGYFSAVSPEAYQSQQGEYEGKARTEFDRGQTDLTRQRDQGQMQIAQALGNTDVDEQNYYAALEQNRLNLLDELGNVALDYSSNIPKQGANYAPLDSSAAQAGIGALNTGKGQTQTDRSSKRSTFKNLGLSDAQIASLEAYLYGA